MVRVDDEYLGRDVWAWYRPDGFAAGALVKRTEAQEFMDTYRATYPDAAKRTTEQFIVCIFGDGTEDVPGDLDKLPTDNNSPAKVSP